MDTSDSSKQLCPTGWQRKRGFTLIELSVVMVIISILSYQAVPLISDSWDKFLLRRVAAQVLVLISVARQHAIADERATLIHFSHKEWCLRYQDEAENVCSLGRGNIPQHFYFNSPQRAEFTLHYSAGRGFSPLSAGSARLFSRRSANYVYFINSSVGRIRLCTTRSISGIPAC